MVPQTDAGVAELMTALNALSVGTQEAEQGPGVQDRAGRGVLKPPDRPCPACSQGRLTRSRLGQVWRSRRSSQPTCYRICDELIARVNKTYLVEDPSDYKLTDGEDVESTGVGARGGGVDAATIAYAKRSSFFGPLEHFAQSCGNDEAGNLLRKAKMSFIRNFIFKPARLADIREFALALAPTQYNCKMILYHTTQQCRTVL